ncbi:VanW family protein [Tumebacillus permanentifrigoris]|uniref:VanW like protein n=1 Tax=Tumebacillus permanentifrigoris TaxID=378543 RepID=A0A316DA85_9BACL|nr:VanW family protein [Tumebacillus permanentifrigoris]PWK09572.1 VanW like protein [Tumebacillus permanentifrigoris]
MGKKQKVWWGVLLSTVVMTGAVLVGVSQWQDRKPVEAATTEAGPKQPVWPADPLREEMKGLREDALTQQRNLDLRRAKARHEAYLAGLATAPGKQIGSFRTSLAGHNASGRVQNIVLASHKLNGKVLLPGEQLSFNDVLGDSNDPGAGWQLATVIVGKKYENGYGGGICQVSTTLYNSVLHAGLKVTERYTHSLPVGYVEPGQDATVSYPELDFKFVNSTAAPVRLQTTVNGDDVTATILQLPVETVE